MNRTIFNRLGEFSMGLPNKTFCLKGEKCSSGKKSRERLIVMCVSMEGEFEKPLIIGNAKKPRCFKNFDVKRLDLELQAKRMKKQGRQVILFWDNATSHPNLQLENVKLVYLPPNTTSHAQPLDQGIIQNFKVRYRRLLITRVR